MVRGRGYSSRGGGRGNSYRSSGSTYSRMGGSRKPDFHESGYRGGNSRYNSGGYNSYESRSRDKFQSRYDNRHDGKRSYRDSSRDRSDDRKRPRQEDSRLSSNYASTSSYRNRNDTSRNRMSSPSGNYQGRGSSSAYHRGQREDSAGRRHATTDSMGPPKRQIRSSYVVRPRGSGTASRVRGSGTARGGMRVIRKESTDMKIMRRKLILARQRDRARLIKIARLTSSLRKRKGPRSSESPSSRKSRGGDKKSDNEEDEEDEDEEVEEEVDEEVDEETGKAKENRDKKKAKSSVKKTSTGGEYEEGDEVGKDDIQSEKEDDEEEDENDNDEEKAAKKDDETMDEDAIEVEDDETKEGKNTSTEKSNDVDGAGESEKEIKDASKEKKTKERKEDSKDSRRKRTSKSPPRRPKFIKLTCVHCRMNCVTFKEYTSHLYSRMHKMAMRRVAIKQRVTLARMRNQQRNAQREIEEKSKDDLEEVKPQFCLLCRLNYRQPKAKHQLSEHHKDMKKFLMPYCQTCHLAFKSPMLYEAHRCSLEHIRRKARSNEANSDVSDDEEKEVDLKNFMTVDSVGEIDDLDDEELENHLNEDPALSNKEKVPVGSQYIKKVEAFYCELCRTYNGLKEDEEAYIKQHCGSRSHLKAFLRHREDENLQAKAERAEKKDKKKETSESEKKTDAAEDAEETGEDKLWEDVDKDLGDLLREVGPDEHDEEEEEEEDESVLNIDIESEKTKPSKEVNGKKEEAGATATEGEVTTKKETPTPVVKVKKEKLEVKANIKSQPINKDKEKKTESSN